MFLSALYLIGLSWSKIGSQSNFRTYHQSNLREGEILLVSLEKNYLNICTKMNSSVILVVQSIMGLATIILMDMSGCVIDK